MEQEDAIRLYIRKLINEDAEGDATKNLEQQSDFIIKTIKKGKDEEKTLKDTMYKKKSGDKDIDNKTLEIDKKKLADMQVRNKENEELRKQNKKSIETQKQEDKDEKELKNLRKASNPDNSALPSTAGAPATPATGETQATPVHGI